MGAFVRFVGIPRGRDHSSCRNVHEALNWFPRTGRCDRVRLNPHPMIFVKRIVAIVLPFVLACSLAAQGRGLMDKHIQELRSKGVRFQPVQLFGTVAPNSASNALWANEVSRADVVRYDREAGQRLIGSGAPHITLELPGAEGTVLLDLERTELSTDQLIVRLASTGAPTEIPAAVHYRGAIRGQGGSFAAISVFGDEVMGILTDASGERILGRTASDAQGLHVLYHADDLLIRPTNSCHVPESSETYTEDDLRMNGADRTLRCVRYYWEVNHDIFLNKGNVVNTTNYVTGLFNQSAILFANDGIDVTLSEVFVWDVPSPYVQTTTGALLDQFGVTRTSFNGDMAHLLGFAGNGGIAWLNTLCNGQTRLRMAYSDINSTFSNVPTYSWSVNVVTHEQGHNLGSQHTHACSWNGNGTAIDGCGPAAGYTEGTCPAGPVPTSAVGGTIMSYCHLLSAGIRFQNGFGPQPTTVMVNRVNSASCLTACGTSCDAPGGLTATAITTTSATLSWASIGATGYTLRWKAVASGTWTTVTGLTGNTYNLSGLTQSTAYEFQVLSICGALSSAYSTSGTFTTATPCPDVSEPNNTVGTAAAVLLPTTINALLATSVDQDHYSFSLTATSTVNLFLGNLAGDYDLVLLTSTGTQLAISENGGTSTESINYANAPAGTYVVRVFGYNGAFSATMCYNLSISAYSVQGCDRPDGLDVDNITWNSAVASWSIAPSAITYDLRWKLSSESIWTTIVGLTANNYAFSNLAPLTSYDVQVRTVCAGQAGSQGGTTSAYTATVVFTTLEAPCEVIPRTVVALKVLLDGPYRTANGLMVDSLRARNLVPLTEPYTALGHVVTGPLSTTATVMAVTGTNAVVDWVLVELRAPAVPHAVLEARVGLVQRDGDVVAVDGVSPLGFCLNAGSYRVAVRHRNHLGCMTGSALALSANATGLDLSASATSTYGTNARKTVGSLRTLWSGNVFVNNSLGYTGPSNDRDPILAAVGGASPTNSATGYLLADVNMDGQVRYTGQDNDRDPILNNIGGSVPTNVVYEQLP